jgi:hypothetical protein
MYDSNRPALIPADPEMVAGYVDGSAQWPADAWDRFTCPKVRISVEPFDSRHQATGYPFGNYHAASVIDVETGAFSPAAAARFVPARNVFRPDTATVYCNKSTLPAVLRACRGEKYFVWLAWYIGHVPGATELAEIRAMLQPFSVVLAAWQWKSGPNYDTSRVYLPMWHDK